MKINLIAHGGKGGIGSQKTDEYVLCHVSDRQTSDKGMKCIYEKIGNDNILDYLNTSSMAINNLENAIAACEPNICGGSEKMVESYSLISNKWTTMPSLLYRKRNGILLLLNETKLYYFGGNQKTKLVQTLDLLKTLTIGWKPLLLNLEVSLTKCGIIPVNRATFIVFGGYEGQENSKNYNNKYYKFDLKENKVEEFENHSITFNLSYKFEECEFIHVDQTFNQVGMNAEGKVNLVSLNKKLFSI